MADKKNSDGDGEEKKKSPIKKLLPIIVAGGLGGAGYFMGSGGEPETIIQEAVETKPYEEIKEVVPLDPINVNLADGHYLRIAVAIGLAKEDDAAYAADAAAADKAKSGDEGPSIETAPASDLVLRTFSGMELEKLQTNEGREEARAKLQEKLVKFYGDKIHTVMFTEFVMQ